MKTVINAAENCQDLVIERNFQLPVHVLYKAFSEAHFVAQWMNTDVVKLHHQSHGSYEFVTTDPTGGIHRFSGTIHEIVQDQKIVRTFEMLGSNIGVTLEVLTFSALSDTHSQLQMHIIYQSVAHREAQLKMPFAWGLNMAHTRLEEIGTKILQNN